LIEANLFILILKLKYHYFIHKRGKNKMRKNLLLIFEFILFSHIVLAGTYSGGTGTSGSPYQIANLNDLAELSGTSGDWNKYFIQTANINASATSAWNGGQGFSPIGNSSTKFTGSFDGQNYIISSLTINWESTENIGFFGKVDGCTIKNLGLVSVFVYGKSNVGGLVGAKDGNAITVENCYTTGTVRAWFDKVGGIIGYIYYDASIIKCYSSASVTGGYSGYAGNYAGGLVGLAEGSNITISKCYSTGSVQGRSYTGGFIGVLSVGEISNSYSRGSVNGIDASGFVDVNSATITNCYSTGSVSGTSAAGFLRSNSGTVNNSFWDTQTSGQSSSSGGTGKTTAEMKTQSTFLNAGWSPLIWYMDAGINDGYPNLSGITPIPVELSMLKAEFKMNSVKLIWKTATEVKNYGFEIQRLVISGKCTEFEKIGFVEGYGNSNSPKDYSFTDENVPCGKVQYRLKQIDTDGKYEYSKTIEIEIQAIIKEFSLFQNYPNPFNPVTTIKYSLPVSGSVTIKIYDVLGNEITTLINNVIKEPGYHSLEFNAKLLPSGIYFYKLTTNGFSFTRKLMLLK
jgi:hypothetical protein